MKKIFIILIIIICNIDSFTQIITVSKTGKSDYQTIQEAVNNSTQGTLIEVHKGIYNEHVVMKENISLLGIGNPVINGDSIGVVITMSSNNYISGFTIKNSGSKRGINDCGILVKNVKNCIIFNNQITHNGHYGIIVENAECNIHNNYITNNAILGIYVNSGSVINLSFNIIMEHKHSAVDFSSANISGLIYNNIIYKNKYGIIYGNASSNALNLKIFNNIFMSNNFAIYCPTHFAKDLSYNCFCENEKNYRDWDDDVDVKLNNTNIFKNPRFKNIKKYNFSLKRNSPCINNGINKTDIGL